MAHEEDEEETGVRHEIEVTVPGTLAACPVFDPKTRGHVLFLFVGVGRGSCWHGQ